jgi:alkaline phosphatase
MKKWLIRFLALLLSNSALSLQSAENQSLSPAFPAPVKSANSWYRDGQSHARQLRNQIQETSAKNVILFVGDGMGISTITAARIYAGQLEGNSGEENQLSFEKFPHTALSKTYTVNTQTPDSAATMTAIVTGVKTRHYTLSVDQNAEVEKCNDSSHVLETILEQSEQRGLSTGIVTTTRITHATPAATFAHSPHRSWESDIRMTPEARQNGCKDIARQLIEFPYGNGPDVVLGGGKNAFLPAVALNSGEPRGERGDDRNLISEWLENSHEGAFVSTTGQLINQDYAHTKQLLGLFADSHMAAEEDRDRSASGEPSLVQMTVAALKILQKNDLGYFLMVEGGRIDHGHHSGIARSALSETVIFSRAIQAAVNLVGDDTLIVVTSDHSHSFFMGGYARRGNNILGKVIERQGKLARDLAGLPYTSLGYGNGPGHQGAGKTRTDLTHVDTAKAGYRQTGAIPLDMETHAGEDVPVYASGPGAQWFRGVIEQNVIYHLMTQALFSHRETEAAP